MGSYAKLFAVSGDFNEEQFSSSICSTSEKKSVEAYYTEICLTSRLCLLFLWKKRRLDRSLRFHHWRLRPETERKVMI